MALFLNNWSELMTSDMKLRRSSDWFQPWLWLIWWSEPQACKSVVYRISFSFRHFWLFNYKLLVIIIISYNGLVSLSLVIIDTDAFTFFWRSSTAILQRASFFISRNLIYLWTLVKVTNLIEWTFFNSFGFDIFTIFGLFTLYLLSLCLLLLRLRISNIWLLFLSLSS